MSDKVDGDGDFDIISTWQNLVHCSSRENLIYGNVEYDTT